AVGGEVVRSAQVVVVHPGGVRHVRVDARHLRQVGHGDRYSQPGTPGTNRHAMRATPAQKPRCCPPTVSSGRHCVASTNPGSTSSASPNSAATCCLVRVVMGLAMPR